MNLETFKLKVLPLESRIFGLSIRLLANREDARDAVQEVFVKLWNRRNRLEEYKSLEAFAITVARNHCLDQLKAKKTLPLDTAQYEIENKGEPNPHTVLERKDAIKQVQSIFTDLPEIQKSIVHLRDIEGYSYEEIAEITEMTINNVRVVLSRARKKIRESLLKQYERNGNQENSRSVRKVL